MSTSDSTSTKRTFTTHDLVTASVTIEAPPTKVGDTQIYAGREFVFTGSKWIPLEDGEHDANDNEA
jgi:hypothetical protein